VADSVTVCHSNINSTHASGSGGHMVGKKRQTKISKIAYWVGWTG